MNFSSMNGLKRIGTTLPILLIAGFAGVGCKEDLDEARSALAAATKDRDALGARVSTLEHELATTRAELVASRKAGPPACVPVQATATGPAATPASAMGGKSPNGTKHHERTKS